MAVTVKNVSFSYNELATSALILNNVCLKVPEGVIYALLGPSGCGKTTLFKLVIGLCKPNSGSIRIFGYLPGTAESGVPGRGIGYMPQELSVQHDLTIYEIFYYFGKLLGMNNKELNHQIDTLVQMFELPEKSRLIGNTSGGQKRRLSMAIAVLHKPRLLVLDEPTVGVDPILCEKIWNMLLSLRKHQKTTIILTTHYFEETRRANIVAYMREGKILEESSPTDILRKYKVTTFEEAFLKIVKAEDTKKPVVEESEETIMYCLKQPLPKDRLTNELLFESKLIAVIYKIMIQTRRNPYTMINLFLLTFMVATMLTRCFGKTPENLSVAWVVDEIPFNNSASDFLGTKKFESFVNESNKAGNYADYVDNEDWVPYLPNILKNSFRNDIIRLKNYESFSVAENDLRENLIHGIIHLRKNFSRCYVECDPFLNLGQEFVDNETVQCGTINLYTDATNKIISSTVEYSVRDSLLAFQKEVAEALGLQSNSVESLLKLFPIYGGINKEDIFGVQDFIVPAAIFYVAHTFGYLPAIMSVAMEQGDEMFLRNYVSGLTALNYVIGQAFARFIFLVLSNLINVFASIYLLDQQCHGSILLVIAMTWMTSIVGLLHGTLIALLVPETIFCMLSGLTMSFNILWCGTIFWSLESQPYFIKWVQYLLPWALPIRSMRVIMAQENAPIHPLIWPGFAVTFFWIVASFVACVHFTKMKK